MNLRLPESVSAGAEDQQNITVSISPEEGYAVNESAVEKKALSATLHRQMKDSGFTFLLIRADERVAYGDIEDILKIGKELGFKRIAFATTPKGA